MKDHEIRELVDELNKEIRKIAPEAPHSLRQIISRIVTKKQKPPSEEVGQMRAGAVLGRKGYNLLTTWKKHSIRLVAVK